MERATPASAPTQVQRLSRFACCPSTQSQCTLNLNEGLVLVRTFIHVQVRGNLQIKQKKKEKALTQKCSFDWLLKTVSVLCWFPLACHIRALTSQFQIIGAILSPKYTCIDQILPLCLTCKATGVAAHLLGLNCGSGSLGGKRLWQTTKEHLNCLDFYLYLRFFWFCNICLINLGSNNSLKTAGDIFWTFWFDCMCTFYDWSTDGF